MVEARMFRGNGEGVGERPNCEGPYLISHIKDFKLGSGISRPAV